MTNLLLKLFVKDTDSNNKKTREKVGVLSSLTGIVCNILLFSLKFIMGTISNSVAVISDAFNNLSDCLSCVITLAGYKLASQPADKDHPFGHGRIEYFTSLFIAVLIIIVGIEFVKTSFDKLIHPEKVTYSTVVLISLMASIVLKIWMSTFNKKLGTDYKSPTMIATSKDSLSDSITTSVTLIGLVVSLFTDLPVDAFIGCVVSILILKSGYEIIKDTVDTLLGKPADEETIEAINELVAEHPTVLGVHDLIVHNYGPGNLLCSFHAEVDSSKNILEIHDDIDNVEREMYEKLHIMTTIHMDPIELNNKELTKNKELVTKVLNEINPTISMHDFRMVPGETHTNLIFDIIMPYEYIGKSHELKKLIDEKLQKENSSLRTVITFDTQF